MVQGFRDYSQLPFTGFVDSLRPAIPYTLLDVLEGQAPALSWHLELLEYIQQNLGWQFYDRAKTFVTADYQKHMLVDWFDTLYEDIYNPTPENLCNTALGMAWDAEDLGIIL